jgi:hypothetical protein
MVLGSGIRDPGSGKSLLRIPDPGVKKAPDPDPQHLKAGSGSGRQAGSASTKNQDPDPHQIEADPQHWGTK